MDLGLLAREMKRPFADPGALRPTVLCDWILLAAVADDAVEAAGSAFRAGHV